MKAVPYDLALIVHENEVAEAKSSKGRERALDLLPGQRWIEYRERRER